MAKFVCDIACFINITDTNLAAERLILTEAKEEMGFDMAKLSEDLKAIMESIGRTVTTKQTILEIYMNRQQLDQAITEEVKEVFPKWGITLVDLELKDIKDAPNSSIISDIEAKIASEIRRDAEIKVASMKQQAEIAKAESEEAYRTRQIEKDKRVSISEQMKEQEVAQAASEANRLKIEAQRKLLVGTAEIEKQQVEQQAQAQRIKYITEAEGQANQIKAIGEAEAKVVQIKKEAEAHGNAMLAKEVGTAEAEVILAKKTAEATGAEKLAEALQKFDEMGINVKMLDIMRDIRLGQFEALGKALTAADIKLILSGENASKFFGINLDAEGGANMQQFIQQLGITLKQLN